MDDDFIYLDYNATTPIDPRVAEAMQPYLSGFFGNPSSSHRLGREARRAVDTARTQVASCLGCQSGEVIFTSGGSESNNMALRGAVTRLGGGHVVTSAIEHPAVLEVLRALANEGLISLSCVGVDHSGLIGLDEFAETLREDTIFASIMLANNEVGTIQPIAGIAAICRQRGVLLHCDAAQAVGKIRVDVKELGVDLLSVAGHKLYAPKGIGALFIREGVEINPLIRGADHEMGLRAGTENVLEEVGLGRACELVVAELEDEGERLAEVRDRLLARLRVGFPELLVNGDLGICLPGTLSVAFPGVDAELLLKRLGDQVAASAGAACHAGDITASHVLTAMGLDAERASSTVRFSVGRFTTSDEIDRGADIVVREARTIAARS